jgi:hypothetical protein
MDKGILDLINNYPAWKGDVYRLAALIVEEQKEIDRAKLIEAGYEDAAQVI